VLVLVNLVPILWSIGISFFRYRADHPTIPPRFVGLGNYVDFVADTDIRL
jgi:multiple sugar transport system permease protein